jgi:threonine synthase
VTLATADAAKFADAVSRAVGRPPVLPPRIADLFERPERCTVLANDLGVVQDHIRAEATRARARQEIVS